MNERILEIASLARKYAREHVEECRRYGYYMEHNEYEIRFEQKFAELIVQECSQFCENNNSKLLGTMMKEHFGVQNERRT